MSNRSGAVSAETKKKTRTLANNLFALRKLFRIAPGMILFKILYAVIDSVVIVFEHTFFVAYVIHCIEMQKGMGDVLAFFVPLTAVILIRMVVSPYVDTYFRFKSDEKIHREIKMQLYEKAARMEIARYDDPAYYNDFVWAMREAPAHMLGAVTSLAQMLATIAAGTVVGAYMLSTDPIGILVVAVSLSLTFVCRSKLVKSQMRRDEETMPDRRRSEYTGRVFYLAEYAKDLRNSRMGEKLLADYDGAVERMQQTAVKHGKKLTWLEYLSQVFRDVLLFDGLYLSYLLYQGLYLGRLSYGVLIALYNSSNAMRGNFDRVVRSIPELQQHSMFIEKLRTFLDTENLMPDSGAEEVPELGDICVEQVSFSYPGNEEATLRDLSLHIRKGDKVAFVGYNGAGKSTLVKLLMRLYDPDSGVIRYGDREVSAYPLAEYRRRFSTVFQEYEIIAASLGENVSMSSEAIREERVAEIFADVDFAERFSAMKQGLKTPMTKEFDNQGVQLSGGEAQKIALSRVLYSDASVLIFDEPSSALDPISEYRLHQTIMEIAQDKTVIIITHRLSTTQFVDRIYMLEDGSIIETGSHEELIRNDGKYAQMYQLQAQKYR